MPADVALAESICDWPLTQGVATPTSSTLSQATSVKRQPTWQHYQQRLRTSSHGSPTGQHCKLLRRSRGHHLQPDGQHSHSNSSLQRHHYYQRTSHLPLPNLQPPPALTSLLLRGRIHQWGISISISIKLCPPVSNRDIDQSVLLLNGKYPLLGGKCHGR